jgi:hypothetical protein
MPALLAAADRPPGELLSDLAGLAATHEVGLDLGREGALVWRLERQPADWQGLVRDMAARLEQVRPGCGEGGAVNGRHGRSRPLKALGVAAGQPLGLSGQRFVYARSCVGELAFMLLCAMPFRACCILLLLGGDTSHGWPSGAPDHAVCPLRRGVQVRHATVCRLDRCYTALAGAAVYSSQAAQERHMRAVINEYFMDEPAAAAADGGADAASDPPAGADGASAAALVAELGAAAMVEYMDSGEMPWGGACPIQRPSRDSLGRQMRAALRSVWARAQDLGRAKFTGLALARLLAGLASPAVPASTWKGSSEWGRLAAVDFRLLVEVGEAVVTEYWEQHQASQAQTAQLLRQRGAAA